MTQWAVERSTGSAIAFHGRGLPDPVARAVWVLDVDRPALVLGSTQPLAAVREGAAAAAGVEVVRRRSGGGAVLLVPGETLWVDVVLPAGDPHWEDDVGRSFHWLGAVWAAALGALGVEAEVHRGGLCTTPWSRRVCFAGLGPGEVTVGGRKAVGIAQRRGRRGARFQCAVPQRWDPAAIVPLLSFDVPDEQVVADLAGVVHTVDVPSAALVDAFLTALGAVRGSGHD